jgi:hypothetical protein
MPDPRCRIVNVRPKGNLRLFPGVSRINMPLALQPEPNVIAMVEHLLDRAKRGEIQGVAAALVTADGQTASNWAGAGRFSCALLIGSLQVLATELGLDSLRKPAISPFPDESA